MNISAVLVTRGDVDLAPILQTLEPVFDDITVWNNGAREDLKVYGRYAAMGEARHDLIYTQDDDALVPVDELVRAWAGLEDTLLVNVPAGEKPWLAWGALVRRMPARLALDAYLVENEMDDDFLNWADVIVSSLVPWRSVDLGHVDFPFAFDENRMFQQPDHYPGQERVERRCLDLGATVRRA